MSRVVTGTWVNADGTARHGSVSFTPTLAASNTTDDEVLLPAPSTVALDAAGSISVTLECTDDANWSNFEYRVIERLVGGREFVCELPSGAGAIDFTDLVALEVATDFAAYALATDLTAHASDTTSVHGIANTANLVLTDDARLADARTPTAHAASHAAAGGDALTLTQAQVTDLATDLAGKVAKTTFDANTILKADSDDTPAALTVDASTIVGRKATGGIAALTGAEVGALLSGISPSAVTGTAAVLNDLGAPPLVLNGDFVHWPRGTSFAPAASTVTRIAARWSAYRATDTAWTVSRVTATGATGARFRYAARVQRDSGSATTNIIRLAHGMLTTDSVPLSGQEVTLSMFLRKGADAVGTVTVYVNAGTGTDQAVSTMLVGGWSGQTDVNTTTVNTADLTTGFTRHTVTATIPANATQVGFRVFRGGLSGTAGAADYVDIAGVQLDFGATALPYRPVPETRTVAECARFVEKLGGSGVAEVLGTGVCDTTTTAQIRVGFAEKRATPTVTVSVGTNWRVRKQTSIATTALSAWLINRLSCTAQATVASGLTAGEAALLTTESDTTGRYLIIEADL